MLDPRFWVPVPAAAIVGAEDAAAAVLGVGAHGVVVVCSQLHTHSISERPRNIGHFLILASYNSYKAS